MFSYLDTSSVQMLAAALAGGVAGFGVLTKMYWHRVLGVFSKQHRREAETAHAHLMGDVEQPTA